MVLRQYDNKYSASVVNLTPNGEQFDRKGNGIFAKLTQRIGLDGSLGTSIVFHNIGTEFASIAVVGLGKEVAGYNQLETIEEGPENARVAAAIGPGLLDDEDCHTIHVDAMNYPEAVAEGSTLSVCRYEENKEASKRKLMPANQMTKYFSGKKTMYPIKKIGRGNQGLGKARHRHRMLKQGTKFQRLQQLINRLIVVVIILIILILLITIRH